MPISLSMKESHHSVSERERGKANHPFSPRKVEKRGPHFYKGGGGGGGGGGGIIPSLKERSKAPHSSLPPFSLKGWLAFPSL